MSDHPTTQTAEAARQFTLTISCPRPRNRAVDDFHVRPDRVASTIAAFVSGEAEMTLTARTVRLRVAGLRHLPDLLFWHRRMAEIMRSLFLDVPLGPGGRCELPSPARTEIRETAPSA